MLNMAHQFYLAGFVALLVAGCPIAAGGASPTVELTRWEGMYRNSQQNEVMRVRAEDSVISIDIFSGGNGVWKLTTAWATTLTTPNYAEFRQRAEPNGLWLSLWFREEGALLQVHDPAQPEASPAFFTRLSTADSNSIVGLPE